MSLIPAYYGIPGVSQVDFDDIASMGNSTTKQLSLADNTIHVGWRPTNAEETSWDVKWLDDKVSASVLYALEAYQDIPPNTVIGTVYARATIQTRGITNLNPNGIRKNLEISMYQLKELGIETDSLRKLVEDMYSHLPPSCCDS